MMIGMKGGAVCASPLVRSSAKAYSFQAKIRQKMEVAAIPARICGSTTFTKGLHPAVAVDHRGFLIFPRNLVDEALQQPDRELTR